MKTTYVKPEIKVRDIQAQESFLAASGEETLQIFNTTMDNDQALSKPSYIIWDSEDTDW